jgi:cyanophycinase
MRTFLIGGGRDEAGVMASHEPFVRAASEHEGPIAVLVLDEGGDTDVDRWTAALTAAGARECRPVVVSRSRTPRPEDVEGASGVYVAGGLTPGYQAVLVVEGTAWLEAARERGIPYAGFSAGAAVAAERAVVGGWRARVNGRLVAVCDEGAGEQLDLVEVREGLGLVPFHVDVHAAQWGTLTRLLHALVADSSPAGAAIDEGTTLELSSGTLRVHGMGLVYWARRTAGAGPAVRFLAGGDESPLTDLL